MAVDRVDDLQFVVVQFHGARRTAILHDDDAEALVHRAPHRGRHTLVGKDPGDRIRYILLLRAPYPGADRNEGLLPPSDHRRHLCRARRGGAVHREPRAPSTSIAQPASGPEFLGKPPFRSRGRTAGVRRRPLGDARHRLRLFSCPPLARRIAPATSLGKNQPLILIPTRIVELTDA